MAEKERFELPSDDIIIPQYLEPDRENISLDRVQTISGVYVGWIVDVYEKFNKNERNKIGQSALEFRIPDMHIYAALRYYNRHKEVIDARVLLNRAYSNPNEFILDEIHQAHFTLSTVKGQMDPLFSRDS